MQAARVAASLSDVGMQIDLSVCYWSYWNAGRPDSIVVVFALSDAFHAWSLHGQVVVGSP